MNKIIEQKYCLFETKLNLIRKLNEKSKANEKLLNYEKKKKIIGIKY